MQNIIEFDITANGSVIVEHNGVVIDYNDLVTVECVKGKNIITITGNDFTVQSISMYGLGKNQLAKIAKKENGTWRLEYQYPVFSWLHKILQHGWLLKEDDEQDTHSKTGS